MKVVFVIDESAVINCLFEVEIDWDCPFLPRLGEAINPSILMLKLTPKEFYESLSKEAKIEWDEWVKKRLDYYEGSIEKAEKGCMTEWLLDMKMCVREIFGDIDERGYKTIFSIAETYNILE